jgi:hypothetical protein
MENAQEDLEMPVLFQFAGSWLGLVEVIGWRFQTLVYAFGWSRSKQLRFATRCEIHWVCKTTWFCHSLCSTA